MNQEIQKRCAGVSVSHKMFAQCSVIEYDLHLVISIYQTQCSQGFSTNPFVTH